jgi:NitT/TauT family transport system substrate-binding protein
LGALGLGALALVGCNPPSGGSAPATSGSGGGKTSFKLAVSIYAGWMPWYYANENQVIKQFGDKYGVDVQVQYMDYPASLDAYVAGKVDAVVLTNMEALDMPAAAGVDTTVVEVGDYSNGNDAVLVRDNLTLDKLKGQSVYLVEKTCSQYLLERALTSQKLKESDVQIVNVSDSDIASSFLANRSQKAVVTWNPMVLEIEKTKGVKRIYDSSQVPGEIQDLLVVNTGVVKKSPEFVRTLVGAWYQTLGLMTKGGDAQEAALKKMADLAHCSVDDYKAQLKTTAMFYTPKDALAFANSADLKTHNDLVRHFCFDHGLLGNNAKSVDAVGISYPDGTIQGDANNVKLRYVTQFMDEAASGKISL